MPTLADQVAALEAERDKLKRIVEQLGRELDDALRLKVAAESRLASARVEGAREALTRVAAERLSGEWTSIAGRGVLEFRDREYPAPAAPAGEQTRPAPTPEPEPLVMDGCIVDGYLRLTHEDCLRIVALGSRPTQTAEGK